MKQYPIIAIVCTISAVVYGLDGKDVESILLVIAGVIALK